MIEENIVLVVFGGILALAVGYGIWYFLTPSGKRYRAEQERLEKIKIAREIEEYGKKNVDAARRGDVIFDMPLYLVREYIDGDYHLRNKTTNAEGKSEEWHYYRQEGDEENPVEKVYKVIKFQNGNVSEITEP